MSTTNLHTSRSLNGYYAWTELKTVHFGPGSLDTALPKSLTTIGATKALIVTGRSLHDKTDVVKKVEGVLKAHGAYAATFYEIGEHAPVAGIRKAVQIFKESGADGIVAVGGGSPIDASKAILYFIQQETGGPYRHQIAIPTTLSAAEYTVGAGYTNEAGNKVAVWSDELAPAAIILDAELTLATPERLWLSTGLRALDHAVENLYRPIIPPPLTVLCYAAIAELFDNLRKSKADPTALDVRQKLLIAAWESIWPLKWPAYAPLGLSHALGHKLGAKYHIPHGITSCLTLAPTVALKAETLSQEDKENLAKALWYLHIPSSGTLEGDILKLSSEIDRLVTDLGLKSTLTEYNVPPADVYTIAEQALQSKENPDYPKVVKLLQSLF